MWKTPKKRETCEENFGLIQRYFSGRQMGDLPLGRLCGLMHALEVTRAGTRPAPTTVARLSLRHPFGQVR